MHIPFEAVSLPACPETRSGGSTWPMPPYCCCMGGGARMPPGGLKGSYGGGAGRLPAAAD